jgi:hypothetical protein
MHGWRCHLGKWMTSAHPLGGIDGLIIVGHAESRWMSDKILPLIRLYKQLYPRHETTTMSMMHEENLYE